METISNRNREDKNQFNILKSDPVITYDHMSESAKSSYDGLKQKTIASPIIMFIVEEIFITALFIIAVYTCL